MSTTDNNWHDAHLKTALEHAPDHHVQASESVRKQVLNYANQATTSQPTWFNRLKKFNHLKNWLLKDHFANAQWAGFTGVAAMLLVAVLLWRQHPEDSVWISATPKEISESSPNQATTIAQTQGKISQDSDAAITQAPPAPINAQRDSALQTTPIVADNQPANPPTLEAKKRDRMNNQHRQAEESIDNKPLAQLNAVPPITDKKEPAAPITNENADVNIDAPVAAMAAPAPTIIAKPAAAEAASEPLSHQKSMVKGITNKKMDDAPINAEDEHNRAVLTDQDKLRQQGTSSNTVASDALANALIAQGGQAIAQRDIHAGTLRLLQIKPLQNAQINSEQKCQKTSTNTTSADPQTGYKIETLVRCEYSDVLIKAIETYNQTMLTWYYQNKN